MWRSALLNIRRAACAGLLLSSLAQASAGTRGVFTLIQQGGDSRTYAYAYKEIPFSVLMVEGKPHLLFQGEAHGAAPGAPHLPAQVLTLGIPAGVTVSAELQNAVFETLTGQEVAPEGTYVPGENNESAVLYVKDPQFYGRNEFLPDQILHVSRPFQLRLQRVVTIALTPCQYNPVGKTLRKLRSARIAIRLTGTSGAQVTTAVAARSADPLFEDLYRAILDNPEEARRSRGMAVAKLTADSTRDWFETGRTYFRIPVARDGWYRISPGELPGLDTSTVRMYFLGKQVPIVVRPDQSVEFYGLRRRGDSTYTDFFTDTSTYWLTWGGSVAGTRFADQPAFSTLPYDTISSSPVTDHYEENKDYYEGTTQAEVTQNGPVPGEGWAWEYYYPGWTYAHTFATDRIDSLHGPTAMLRARLQSTTLHYSSPDHKAQFRVNDSLVGEWDFNGREGVLAELAFPARWLRQGENALRITSLPTASSPNQFYLDWYEVRYQRDHVAAQDEALLAIPAGTPRTTLITASGFRSASLEVFDLTSHRRIPPRLVAGDSLSGFSLEFIDTIGTARTYLVTSTGSAEPLVNIQSKTFQDIRVNAVGADYILISHANFLSAAQRLAAHRATFNGVRTRVVDVQDIYDEFNYGHIGTDPIKTFLLHAYEHWPGAPPSSVVMFGDACWDYHRYMTTTIKSNYVPAYGVPAGDNWFVCFDALNDFLPSLAIGRIPVENPQQAERTVDKLIGYDTQPPADWNKNFMFISGGTTPAEQVSFNSTTTSQVDTYIAPAPIGGTAFKIFKTTPDAIDGEHKEEMRQHVKDGLSVISFLGHSGGRFWGVDIGSPADMENTSGQLPFVSSVSCNIGSFAEPSNNVLAEDFVLADNRGGIAAWGSSSLGYANIGTTLFNLFLTGVISDTLRSLGVLTTAARIGMWEQRGSDYISIASVNLNPLIGDPLTSLALARKPELALASQDITTNAADAGTGDSILTIRIDLHNFGLVAPESVGVSLTDAYANVTRPLLQDTRVRPILHHDSLFVPWSALNESGPHLLTATLDPLGAISEVDEANNSATKSEYVFGRELVIVRPFDNMVVAPGSQTLVVTPQQATDTLGYSYEFEIDTAVTFDSPVLVRSGSVAGGPVGGRWTTPQIMTAGSWFWRVRSVQGGVYGQWVNAAFVVAGDAPALPLARWKQASRGQFGRGVLSGTAITDSGVTISATAAFHVVARSLGYRGDYTRDYYSYLQMNEQVMLGYWWVLGNSFLVLRANERTGAYEFKSFNVAADSAKASEMTAYLSSVGEGETIALTVVVDGYTNVTEGLRQAIRTLGSTKIDSVLTGHSWMMISRMGSTGPRDPVLEHWSPDGVAADSLQLTNYYTLGSGSLISPAIAYPAAWNSLHLRGTSRQGLAISAALFGTTQAGLRDTLIAVGGDSFDVDLSSLSGRVLADSAMASVSLASTLSTSDGESTPTMREWWVDLQPAQELVISPRTIEPPSAPIVKGDVLELPITVHNIGYRTSSPSIVQVLLSTGSGPGIPVAEIQLNSIPSDGSLRVIAPIQTSALSGSMTATVKVIPRPESHDLIALNNQARVSLTVAGGPPVRLVLFADGTKLMDGDYVAVRPAIVVQLQGSTFDPLRDRAELYIDDQSAGSMKTTGEGEPASLLAGEPTFNPTFSEGRHDLLVVLIKGTIVGVPDTVRQRLVVNVDSRYRILNLYNYPNPFQRETYFTFVLAGAQGPDEVRIRIYTVAGRKIQQIVIAGAGLQIGFNRIPWDGRDAEGDEIANGTYLYQVEVRAGGTTVVETQKLVRVR